MHAFHMRERIKALRKAADLAEATALAFERRGQEVFAAAKRAFASEQRAKAAQIEAGVVI